MKYSWLIDKYLDGTLTNEEIQEFYKDLKSNPKLADEVRRLKMLNDIIFKHQSGKNKSSNEFPIDQSKTESDENPLVNKDIDQYIPEGKLLSTVEEKLFLQAVQEVISKEKYRKTTFGKYGIILLSLLIFSLLIIIWLVSKL